MKRIENFNFKMIHSHSNILIIILLSLSIFFLFNSCQPSSVEKTPIDIYKIEDEEYVIYSIILSEMNKEQFTIISDTTFSFIILDELCHISGLIFIKRSGIVIKGFKKFLSIYDIGFETIENFGRKNFLSFPLEYKFKLKNRYLLKKPPEVSEYKAVIEKGRDWCQEFCSQYPNSYGYFSFSRVGFNREKNKALVYVRHILGPGAGIGQLLYFKKTNGLWKFINGIGVWRS